MQSFYDFSAYIYDFLTWGEAKRYREVKRKLFAAACGRVLLVGAGTGVDLPLLPPGQELIAIDVSAPMLARAKKRESEYRGNLSLRLANIEKTDFPDHYFTAVVTSCVFCSVADPIAGLKEIKRILRPGGRLLMFEHVLSKNPLLKPCLYLMNLLIPSGPDFTRNTVANVKTAGFEVIAEQNVYMDIVKGIVAQPQS